MNKNIMIILLFLLIANFSMVKTTVAQTTMVYVDPQLTTIEEIGKTFEINVTISQVTDLAAWEFKLYYESSVLNATSITEGPFLKSVRQTTGLIIWNFTDTYNATHGRIWVACSLVGSGPGADGVGTLATITFKAKGFGTANLHLADTDLLDSQMPPNRIPHTTRDGTVKVSGYDIAVTNVILSKTAVGQGYSMHINVTVKNKGNFIELFNVTAYADLALPVGNEITIGKQEVVNLPYGETRTLSFFWNTTLATPKGSYTISAIAEPVPGETNTGDNTCIDGVVRVTRAGDFGTIAGGYYNFDGLCDYQDLYLFRKAYVIVYHELCDLDNNHNVDYIDLFEFRKCYIIP